MRNAYLLLLALGCASSLRETTLARAYTGQQDVAVVEGVAAAQYVGMAVSKPTDLVFRVIDRRGMVCCARPAIGSARIELRNKHLDYRSTKGRLEMVWKLTDHS